MDEGYAAVTQDNGVQKILPGGHTHMLTHRNWKFEKFMTQKRYDTESAAYNSLLKFRLRRKDTKLSTPLKSQQN